MAIATDLGVLTPVVQDNLMGCDLVALIPTMTHSACTAGRTRII